MLKKVLKTLTLKVAKNEEMANEDSPVESQSVGAVDDVDDSTDEKDTAEMIKLKKLLVIVGCAISFIIMLALAIKYGQVRKQAAKESESNSQVIAAPTLAPVETSPPTIASTTVPTEFDPFRKCEEKSGQNGGKKCEINQNPIFNRGT